MSLPPIPSPFSISSKLTIRSHAHAHLQAHTNEHTSTHTHPNRQTDIYARMYSSCRYLGFWSKANGDMQATKNRVLEKTREVVSTLCHHPLEAKISREQFLSTAGSVFRFSVAQVPWTSMELDKLLHCGLKRISERRASQAARRPTSMCSLSYGVGRTPGV